MKTTKSDFKDKKKSLSQLQRSADTSWSGNLFNTKYDKPLEDLISDVNDVIGKIDDNLDRINNKINDYENIKLCRTSRS
ncbi:DUF5082 family protein [Streptococcus suis]|uniref:DUF5082 family protein n=1 Tax=Streptococcus suis TaxID=1307 RepID=UPI00147896EF